MLLGKLDDLSNTNMHTAHLGGCKTKPHPHNSQSVAAWPKMPWQGLWHFNNSFRCWDWQCQVLASFPGLSCLQFLITCSTANDQKLEAGNGLGTKLAKFDSRSKCHTWFRVQLLQLPHFWWIRLHVWMGVMWQIVVGRYEITLFSPICCHNLSCGVSDCATAESAFS